jgi:ankyrin repeat protein
MAALHGKHFQVAELLYRHSGDVEVRGNWVVATSLHMASATGLVDVVEWLLNHGADINAEANDRWTALHYAACHSRLKAVRMLLERGADVNPRNAQGEVPLHLATIPYITGRDSDLDIMQLLLDSGADANARDNAGSTPLHHSSYKNPFQGTVEGSHLLLKHGAHIYSKDDEGRTPLQLALAHGRDEMARFLSEHASGATST